MIITVSSAIDKLVMVYHSLALELFPDAAPHPLLRTSGTHEHPDGPILGFVVPEREVADADASTSLDHTRANPDRSLDFDLTSLTSLDPSQGERRREVGRLAHAARSWWYEREPGCWCGRAHW